jgi:hypothetical protein
MAPILSQARGLGDRIFTQLQVAANALGGQVDEGALLQMAIEIFGRETGYSPLSSAVDILALTKMAVRILRDINAKRVAAASPPGAAPAVPNNPLPPGGAPAPPPPTESKPAAPPPPTGFKPAEPATLREPKPAEPATPAIVGGAATTTESQQFKTPVVITVTVEPGGKVTLQTTGSK